jgi:hypothetical protein
MSDSEETRAGFTAIGNAGGFSALVACMLAATSHVQAAAARAVANLATIEAKALNAAVAGPAFVASLQSTSIEVEEPAARAVANCLVSNCEALISVGAIPALVECMRSSSLKLQVYAVAVITILVLVDRQHLAVVTAGAIPALVDFLHATMQAAFIDTSMQEYAVFAIACLSTCKDALKEVGAIPGSVPALVACLRSSSLKLQKNPALFFSLPRIAVYTDRHVFGNTLLALLAFLKSTSPKVQENAGLAVANFIEDHCVLRTAGAIPALVACLECTSPAAQKNAAGAMALFATVDPENFVEGTTAAYIPSLVAFLKITSLDSKELAAMVRSVAVLAKAFPSELAAALSPPPLSPNTRDPTNRPKRARVQQTQVCGGGGVKAGCAMALLQAGCNKIEAEEVEELIFLFDDVELNKYSCPNS